MALNNTNYSVDEKDTVAGRLAASNNFNDPISRQTASVARRVGASRGMGNSSVTIGEGLGAVLAQKVDIAKADSTNIINTNNQNALNNTNMRNVDAGSTSSEKIASLTTDTQKQIQQAEAQANRENLAAELATRERMGSADRAAAEKNLGAELTSREKIANTQISADILNQAENRQVERERTASTATTAAAGILAQERQEAFNRDHALLIKNLDSANQLKIEQMRMSYQDNAQKRDEMGAAWSNYQAGLASIDANATSASQNAMFARITEAFEARMDFISGTSYTPATTTTPSAGVDGVSTINRPVTTTTITPTTTGSTQQTSTTPVGTSNSTAQATFTNTLNNLAPLLEGTGGQGVGVQATIQALVNQGKAAGMTVDQIAAAAASVFPHNTVAGLTQTISGYY